MEWQPIETAPKDGTLILTLVPGYTAAVSKWQESRGMFDFIDEEDMPNDQAWIDYLESDPKYHPTHWMPLPEPPKCK